MALSAALVWECRASGASDSNGGAFKAGATGTDRSQQNAAQVAIDNSTITTSITANVITFTGYTPTSADVGNVVQMLTGTNVTAGFYEITAQTGTTWTVTGTVNLPTSGTTTNATGNMGGALATLNKLSGAMVAKNKGFATGAFTSAATITFAQAITPTAANPPTRLIGYGSVRGDSGHATLTLQTNTGLTGLNLTASGSFVENIDVDCASLGTSKGIRGAGTSNQVTNCKVANFTISGIEMTGSNNVIADCELTGGSAAAAAAINVAGATSILRCFVHDNACPGIFTGTQAWIVENLVVNNSGGSSDGINVDGGCKILNNTCHNNGGSGINWAVDANAAHLIKNNLLTSNGAYGLDAAAANPALPEYDGNVYWNNTSGARHNVDSTSGIYGVSPYTNVRDVTLSGSPYVGGTTGSTANFALNNTAGAGAACRAAGVPSTWPGNTGTTGYLDMGAVQHQDTGGSGGGPGHVLVVRGQNLPAY